MKAVYTKIRDMRFNTDALQQWKGNKNMSRNNEFTSWTQFLKVYVQLEVWYYAGQSLPIRTAPT